MGKTNINRRDFLVSASAFAGGMTLVLLPAGASLAADAEGLELSPWLTIARDDTVTVRAATPENGNGASTQIAMNLTEELGCNWSKVRVEFFPPQRDWVEKGAFGKQNGTLGYFAGHSTDPNRMKFALQAGASARERLKAAAAARWKVSASEIDAHNSVLTHSRTGRKLRYGEVAAQAATVTLTDEPALKPQSEWTFLTKASPSKLGLPDIVKGAAVYGIDVKLPGMVYAALLQSPVHGGKLKHHDPSAVLKMPGVRAVVVLDPSKTVGVDARGLGYRLFYGLDDTATQSAVAVIADHYWQGKMALDALPVEWDAGPGAQWKTTEQIYDAARKMAAEPSTKPLINKGDANAISGKAAIDVTYLTPYCENATMEPLNGTALVTADRVDVWHPSQEQQQAWWVAIHETGMAPEKVHFHQTLVGGGFGRRVLANDVRMVVAIAKEYPGVPVHVIWSREETTRQGRYRTLIASRFQAKLNKENMPEAVKANACLTAPISAASSFGDSPYFVAGAIPNLQVGTNMLPMHILTGAYRGPSFNSFVFMVETFIDECAVAAKIDPLEYRLKLLETWDPAWSTCLRVAAEKSGWGKPLPKGQGRGIAICGWPTAGRKQSGTVICAAATVEVTGAGELNVKAIDVTFDCGRVANRDAVLAQLEGGTIFGLNMALNEEITIRDGAVVEGNFDQYSIMRIAEVPPKINIHFEALSGHDRFELVGEPPVGPVGPAVGNAIFQATGKRLRSTPFVQHNLNWT